MNTTHPLTEATQAVLDHSWDYDTHTCTCGYGATDSLDMATHVARHVVTAWEEAK